MSTASDKISPLRDAKVLNRLGGPLLDAKALDRAFRPLLDAKALDHAFRPLLDAKALDHAFRPLLDAKALDHAFRPLLDAKALDHAFRPLLDAKALDRLLGPLLDSQALTRPDLETIREHLSAQHQIDSGDVEPQELLDAATREDILDNGDTSAGRIPVDPQGRVDDEQPVTSRRIAHAWRLLQALRTLDNLLGDPGVTAVREKIGEVANEVLLLILLFTKSLNDGAIAHGSPGLQAGEEMRF